MTSFVGDGGRIPVLIIGAGPVGLGLANDLGWRGVGTLLVEQGDGTFNHPRANTVNVRTMEFCRRWRVAEPVRRAGAPSEYPHTALYLTSLTGYEIARIERPSHGGGGKSSPFSPERPQRCNQMWFDPILRDHAAKISCVTLRNKCRFESFQETADGIIAELHDLETDKRERVAASYLVACCGGQSSIRDTLGIEMEGTPVQSYPIDIFIRAPELWSLHDKGKAVLHFLIGPEGVWGTLGSLNGNDLWRLTIHGTDTFQGPKTLDAEACLARAVGADFPHEVLSVVGWVRRELVATRFSQGRVFLAGDCAHVNSPSGGFGMNTGMGDAADLGWKLAATIGGWGGGKLLDSYSAERRQVAIRNVSEATRNFEVRNFAVPDAVFEESAAGVRSRNELNRKFMTDSRRRFNSFGIALGYRYDPSPICIPDGVDRPSEDMASFHQTSHPGCRAPHGWLPDGRSIIDLYGHGFSLLRFGENAPEAETMIAVAAQRGVPLDVTRILDPELCELYQRRLVLVRPDGHVAWRSDDAPSDPMAVIDRVRGA